MIYLFISNLKNLDFGFEINNIISTYVTCAIRLLSEGIEMPNATVD